MQLIPLTQGKFAKVDDSDYEHLMQFKWHYTFYGYAARRVGKQIILMHRYLKKVALQVLNVDHKDRDPLNNQKFNLRICSKLQNNVNSPARKTAFSKYKGVQFKKHCKRWCANIAFNKKTYHLGYFDEETDAAKAYDIKAKEFFGEFAYLNFK